MKLHLSLTLLATLLAGSTPVLAEGEDTAAPGEPTPTSAPVMTPPIAQDSPPQQPVADEHVEKASVSGFALEVRLETAQVVIDDDFVLPGIAAGLFLGHRSRSVTIGVGFELARLSQSTSTMGTSSDQSITSLLVLPGVRFTVARSADEKTELLGVADAGYGLGIRRGGGGTDNPPNIGRIRAQAGLGLRHWITPSFAIGGTAGLRFDRQSVTSDNGGGLESTQSLTTTSLFTSLQMTGVF